jgi:hypothetical protein
MRHLISPDTGRLLTALLPLQYDVSWDITALHTELVTGRVTITAALQQGTTPLPLALHAKRGVVDVTSAVLTLQEHKGGAPVQLRAQWEWSPQAGEDAGHVRVFESVVRDINVIVTVGLEFAVRVPMFPDAPGFAMQGLYVARSGFGSSSSAGTAAGTRPQLLATQFQPTSARRAFPCVDEPAAKAVFIITVRAPQDWLILNNTSVVSVSASADATTTTTFAPTPAMAPYLVALVAAAPGQLVPGVSRTVEALHGIRRSPVIVRTWCRSDDEVYKTQLAADTAAGALVFMETLTEMAYPLGKLDLVSVDAFDSGAMENWGLMLFRPAALLAGRAASAAERYGVLSTVAHEVAHQWFGNQATCAWWDDLWLNEGFATLCAVWYAACGYDHATLKPAVFLTEALCPATSACPAWNVWVQWILTDGASALHDRAVVNAAAKVITDADIAAQFDGATYNRAAAVLRLVMLCMGVEAAIPALRVYLQTPVVTEDALWQCLGPAAQAVGAPWLRAAHLITIRAGGGVGGGTAPPAIGPTPLGLGRADTVTENLLFCMPAVIARGTWDKDAAQQAVLLALQLSPATGAAMLLDAQAALQAPDTSADVITVQLHVLRVVAGAGAGAGAKGACAQVMHVAAVFAGSVLRTIAETCGTAAVRIPKPGMTGRHSHDLDADRAIIQDVVAAIAPGTRWTKPQVLHAIWHSPVPTTVAAFEAVTATGCAQEWLPGAMATILGARVVAGANGADGSATDFDTVLAVVQKAANGMFVPDFMNGAADNGAALWQWLVSRGGWKSLHQFAVGKFGVRSVAEVMLHGALTSCGHAKGKTCVHAMQTLAAQPLLSPHEIAEWVYAAKTKLAAQQTIQSKVCPVLHS